MAKENHKEVMALPPFAIAALSVVLDSEAGVLSFESHFLRHETTFDFVLPRWVLPSKLI